MDRYVNAIAGRLSLRSPQRQALEILDRITKILRLEKGVDTALILEAIRSEFPTVTDFERDFPSLCFALATGVGKTRLMGAFIAYLHLSHGINNFFVLAPNLTIYNKLIADFTQNTPKYVFKGIAEFSTMPPDIITGENYERSKFNLGCCKINIFNISKINSEVRGGKSPRIKRLSEYIGESYFDYLAGLPDLVLLMDESHRYRASAGVRAINELKPVLGLELTATPFVETGREPVPFKNVILDYPLGRAMTDGFVKEPAVVTRKDFNPVGMSVEEIERLKLEDGVHLHENIKVELEIYARETDNPIVKPFILVIARDTTHASQLLQLIQSDAFFEGHYAHKVIQVDSSKTGTGEDEMIERLLKVELTSEPTEIVIHVNMLKEGWDVTNLYTIVPLRAANARTLIEQSIGRGLRLPYGKRTGVTAVDRLNIIAHDKFQEIVDEANQPNSTIRLQQVILAPEEQQKTATIVSPANLMAKLGFRPDQATANAIISSNEETPAFLTPEEQEIAKIAYSVVSSMDKLPSVTCLQYPEAQETVLREVMAQYKPKQLMIDGIKEPDIAAIVTKTTELIIQQTINIPRIIIMPRNKISSGFRPFPLDLSAINYQAPSDELWIKHLRTDYYEKVGINENDADESRLEDYIVSVLIDFDDISYDDHADFLYSLASQVTAHLLDYLSNEDAHKVLRLYQRNIANLVHVQMQEHYWEEKGECDVVVSKGFTALKPCNFTASAIDSPLDFRVSPTDKSNMAKYLFGGFQKCLYPVQKFHSDAERKMAVILERESLKWFRPVRGQLQIFYKRGADHQEYQPDFIAETTDTIYMLEPKAANQMSDDEVLAKQNAAYNWCCHASDHAKSYGGKPWKYLLIPHDAIAENMTLKGLEGKYTCRP